MPKPSKSKDFSIISKPSKSKSIKGWKEYLKTINDNKYNLDQNDINLLSVNPNITMSDVISNINIKWNYDFLTINQSIPISYILDTMYKYPWNLCSIFQRIRD